MKKILAMLLCALLALTLFAACSGGKGGEDETTTTENGITEPVDVTLATDPAETASAAETTTEAATEATTENADPFAAPANLNTLSKAEQLEYFNLVANRVREEKPGYTNDILRKIDKIKLSGAASVANPIVEMVKNSLMPGEWEKQIVKKGESNRGKFFSDNANASDLRLSDVASITCTKSGDGWIIKINVIKETNPGVGTSSANSRVNVIMTRENVLKEITNISDAIKADVNNATLNYHSGYASLTVNAQGQVTSAESGFQVDATANDVKISFIKTNVQAPQSSVVKSHSFIW